MNLLEDMSDKQIEEALLYQAQSDSLSDATREALSEGAKRIRYLRRSRFWLIVGLLWALGCVYARGAEPVFYPTLESAATAALADAEALTPDFEAGGSLYACGERYVYDAPATSGKRDRVDIATYSYVGCVFAGTYHTHPARRLVFSRDDVASICASGAPGFMKPRGEGVRVFDCRGLVYAQLASVGRPIYGVTL